jgi:hypothetical protein
MPDANFVPFPVKDPPDHPDTLLPAWLFPKLAPNCCWATPVTFCGPVAGVGFVDALCPIAPIANADAIRKFKVILFMTTFSLSFSEVIQLSKNFFWIRSHKDPPPYTI